MPGWLRRNADLIATVLIVLSMGFGSLAGTGLGKLTGHWSFEDPDFRPRVTEMPKMGIPRFTGPSWQFRFMSERAQIQRELQRVRCTVLKTQEKLRSKQDELRREIRTTVLQRTE